MESCQQAGPLLHVLGYKLKATCGPDAALETSDPERAFLTVDSGFPLADLEQSLRENVPFVYPFSISKLPVILTEKDWTALESNRQADTSLVDAILHDANLAHLYWDFGQMDNETRESLRQSPGLPELIPYAGALGFYGGQISIRAGSVVVPGGKSAEPAWSALLAASPSATGRFVVNLLAKDGGLAAAYFDALSRVSRDQQTYFVDSRRLSVFYEAFREARVRPAVWARVCLSLTPACCC